MNSPLHMLAMGGWGHRSAVWEALDLPGAEIQPRALPGHEPQPGAPPPECSLEAAAASCRGHWDLVMGWSLGGLAALHAIETGWLHPRALILVAVPPSFLERPGFPAGMPRSQLEELQQGLREDARGALQRFYALQFRGDRAPRSRWAPSEIRDRYLAYDADPEVLSAWLDVLADTDLVSRTPSLEVPVLAVHGSEDPVVSPDSCRFYRDCGWQVAVATIPGAGHAPHITHPHETGKRIGEFLRAVAG